MRNILVVIVSLGFAQIVYSQQIVDTLAPQSPKFFETYVQGYEGDAPVYITQDSRLDDLVNRHIMLNIQNESKISGWRIQIYNSSGAESRKEAQDVRSRFLAKYPELTAYVIYQPPFFKIRVGDFRTREEAYMIYKQIVQEFPVSYLVNDMINLPKLK